MRFGVTQFMEDPKTRYCFLAEWFDVHAQLYRSYELLFYPSDGTIEMYDKKLHRTFLKRSKADIRLKDLFIGASVNVHARQLLIRDFGDEFTRKSLASQMERFNLIIDPSSLLVIKESGLGMLGSIVSALYKDDYTLCHIRLLDLDASLGSKIGVSGRVAVMEVLKKQAVNELQNFLNGNAGSIIQDILDQGFQITDMEFTHIDSVNAEEFLEVYKGVLMLNQLTAGPILAMYFRFNGREVTGGGDVVSKFRACVGPWDPNLAKTIRPQSLRAKYGSDRVKNAVHCTDLPQDGLLEVMVYC